MGRALKDRVPPNQRATDRFPTLTYLPTPRISLNEWRFDMTGLVIEHDQPGLTESSGYYMHGDPWKEERHSR
jgi:hypothetical protein